MNVREGRLYPLTKARLKLNNEPISFESEIDPQADISQDVNHERNYTSQVFSHCFSNPADAQKALAAIQNIINKEAQNRLFLNSNTWVSVSQNRERQDEITISSDALRILSARFEKGYYLKYKNDDGSMQEKYLLPERNLYLYKTDKPNLQWQYHGIPATFKPNAPSIKDAWSYSEITCSTQIESMEIKKQILFLPIEDHDEWVMSYGLTQTQAAELRFKICEQDEDDAFQCASIVVAKKTALQKLSEKNMLVEYEKVLSFSTQKKESITDPKVREKINCIQHLTPEGRQEYAKIDALPFKLIFEHKILYYDDAQKKERKNAINALETKLDPNPKKRKQSKIEIPIPENYALNPALQFTPPVGGPVQPQTSTQKPKLK